MVQINFTVSMDNVIFHFSYSLIVNCSMDNVKEHFTHSCIVNSNTHVQLDELV